MGAVLTVDDVRHRRGGREVLRVDTSRSPPASASDARAQRRRQDKPVAMLAGIDEPTAGAIRIDGVAMSRGDAALRRRLAYAPQRPLLLSTTVRHNVELPLRWRRARATRRAVAAAALGAPRRRAARRPPSAHALRPARPNASASRGRWRALQTRCLLDEPAAGLDTPTREGFFADVARALADRARTVVAVSHRPEEGRPRRPRRGPRRRRVTADRARRRLESNPADAAVARLMGYENVIEVDIDDTPPPTARCCSRATQDVRAARTPTRGPGNVGRRGPPVPARRHAVRATVERASTGPGWRGVTLDAGVTLRAPPPQRAPPPPGSEVSVELDRLSPPCSTHAERSLRPRPPAEAQRSVAARRSAAVSSSASVRWLNDNRVVLRPVSPTWNGGPGHIGHAGRSRGRARRIVVQLLGEREPGQEAAGRLGPGDPFGHVARQCGGQRGPMRGVERRAAGRWRSKPPLPRIPRPAAVRGRPALVVGLLGGGQLGDHLRRARRPAEPHPKISWKHPACSTRPGASDHSIGRRCAAKDSSR